LSKRYSYFTLKRIPKNENSLSEVYGDLKIEYPEEFQSLIDNHVLEIATFYAKKYGRKEILKYVDSIKLSEMVATKAFCKKEYFFENYPQIKFNKILYFSEKSIPECVSLIPEYNTEVDGLPVKVNALPFDTALIGWHDVSTPVLVVKSTPGKNKGYIKARWDADDIKDKKLEIYQKTVHRLKSRLDVLEPIAEKYKIMADEANAELVKTIKNIKSEKELNIARMYNERLRNDPRFQSSNESTDWSDLKPYLILLGVLVIVVIAIFLFQFFTGFNLFGGGTQTPTASLFTSLIYMLTFMW
jgi:hypothetical protein